MGLAVVSAQYDPRLQYQRRGDRDEGLRLIPVGGLDIELMSARIDGATQSPPAPLAQRPWSESVRARFFVPETASLYLTLRQLRSRSTYYWLNYPEPVDKPQRWDVGRMNEYVWPTEPVLRQLPNVHLDDLGAVVRVARPDPGKVERVLPVDLTDGAALASPGRYRFSLKTNGKAFLTAKVYRADVLVYTRPATWEQAGSPITVLWDPASCPTCKDSSWYRLVLSGYFENNTPLEKEVQFYHRPRLDIGAGPR